MGPSSQKQSPSRFSSKLGWKTGTCDSISHICWSLTSRAGWVKFYRNGSSQWIPPFAPESWARIRSAKLVRVVLAPNLAPVVKLTYDASRYTHLPPSVLPRLVPNLPTPTQVPDLYKNTAVTFNCLNLLCLLNSFPFPFIIPVQPTSETAVVPHIP